MIKKISSLYTMIEERRMTFGLLLTILGFVFWFIVISTYRVWWVPPTNTFGLYQVIPIWYWLGIILLICGMLFPIDLSSRLQFILQFILLNLMVWGTPVFIEPNARVTDTWIHFGRTQTILETGHISFTTAVDYPNWPGSFIFNTMNLRIMGIDSQVYIKFYPLLSSTIFIFGYYLLVRRIVKYRTAGRFALLLGILFNVWLQFHFSPQSFALMIFPLIIVGFLKNEGRWWFVTGILCTTLILSHPTTSIFLAAILFGVFFANLLLNILSKSYKLRKRDYLVHGILLMIIMIGTFFIFYQTGSLDRLSSRVVEGISNIPESMGSIFVKRASQVPSLIRLVVFIIIGVLSLISIYTIRKDRELLRLSVGWIGGSSLIFLIDIGLPGAHFHNRALFFLYMIFPILVSLLAVNKVPLKRYKKSFTALLVILSLLNLTTIYYQENEAIISDSNLDATDFVITHTTDEPVYVEQSSIIRAFVPKREVRGLSGKGEIPDGTILIFDDYALESDVVGERTGWRYSYLTQNKTVNLVYSSDKFEVYLYNITS